MRISKINKIAKPIRAYIIVYFRIWSNVSKKVFSDDDGFTVWGVKAVPHFRQNLSSGDIYRPQLGHFKELFTIELTLFLVLFSLNLL